MGPNLSPFTTCSYICLLRVSKQNKVTCHKTCAAASKLANIRSIGTLMLQLYHNLTIQSTKVGKRIKARLGADKDLYCMRLRDLPDYWHLVGWVRRAANHPRPGHQKPDTEITTFNDQSRKACSNIIKICAYMKKSILII